MLFPNGALLLVRTMVGNSFSLDARLRLWDLNENGRCDYSVSVGATIATA
jgi:hypothetical protein